MRTYIIRNSGEFCNVIRDRATRLEEFSSQIAKMNDEEILQIYSEMTEYEMTLIHRIMRLILRFAHHVTYMPLPKNPKDNENNGS
jgi:glutamate formiminotransferase